MSSKNVDFSNGIRGKYARTKLKIVGGQTEELPEKNYWAICIHHNSNLIERKIYLVRAKPNLAKVSVKDETGKVAAYPLNWFLPVVFDQQISEVLQKLP
ncbi:MAG: hypothetical protein ACR2LT_00805 [Pyrinomonadaceae bacterium]